MKRVLALSFDAADGELLRRWAESGDLPVLGGLMERGGVARLRSDAALTPESTWASIISGCRPPTHGVYDWREMEPGTYVRRRRPSRSFRRPFWELLQDGAAPAEGPPRVILLDVPSARRARNDLTTSVLGWGQRGAIRRVSWPEGLLDEVTRRHGGYVHNLNRDVPGRPLLERLQLRSMERMVARRTEILRDLMAEHPWDICLAPYFESHYAGHAFHMYAARDDYIERVPRGAGLRDALLRVYQAVDASVGELIEAAPAYTHVAAFSGFGLRPNTSGTDVLPGLLEKLGYTAPGRASGRSRRRELIRRAGLAVVPRPLARAVRRRTVTPEEVDRHLEQLWTEGIDWSRTRAWAETEPGSAYIWLNVAGRQPQGIVAPGQEYDDLCAEIVAELKQLTDARTGVPAVEEVIHRDEFGAGPHVDALPDLLVTWTRTAVIRSAHHPRAGLIEEGGLDWKVTEHNDNGLLVLAGPCVAPGTEAADAGVEDIAPTLMHLMGGAVPADGDGRPLTELLKDDLPPVRRAAMNCADDGWGPDA